jgi:2-oxoglutarate/2-oxoacid ferredoxin oxidoreductase subunit alpha
MDNCCSKSDERRQLLEVRESTVRFAGDSGDGMQLVGSQFADLASLSGCVIRTIPDYPSEIRAPAGSLAGVSGYQLCFGDQDIMTPGDHPYVLVAMNPAALKVSLSDLQPGGIIIVPMWMSSPRAHLGQSAVCLQPAGRRLARRLPSDPSQDQPSHRRSHEVPPGLPGTDRARCKNFFALGMVLWLYDQPMQPLLEWLMKQVPKVTRPSWPPMAPASAPATTSPIPPNCSGSISMSHPPNCPKAGTAGSRETKRWRWDLIAASCRAQRPIVYASYPITPASDILHELSARKEFDVRVLQCEDEIAACCAAIGASFAGALGVTGTSGPGLALKTEAMGLAVMTELPLIVINVQRAGPSTGMPTKTEQSDLLMAIYGRHGESPAVVLAGGESLRLFCDGDRSGAPGHPKYMTPVIVLSDSFLANSAEAFSHPRRQCAIAQPAGAIG